MATKHPIVISDPNEWRLEADDAGWFIVNEYGEEIEFLIKQYYRSSPRWRDYKTALAALNDAIAEALDNYEPPDPYDTWRGGEYQDYLAHIQSEAKKLK